MEVFADYVCISEDVNPQQLMSVCKTDIEGRFGACVCTQAEFVEP